MSARTPAISVIMPAFNAELYLDQAVQSILTQTHRDFEFIIINDGSTDSTPALLDHLAATDPRIGVIHQPNQRIVATLNRAVSLATAPFIAIMHADDIALPTRLEKQLAYLQAHPEIQLAGTWIQTFSTSPDGQTIPGRQWQYPSDPDFIACFLLFWCCLAHPTVMLRRSTFTDFHYDPAFNHAAEDYALWAAASTRYKIGNVPEVLLHYRAHPAQNSHLLKPEQRAETRAIRRGLIRRLGITHSEAQMDLHQQLAESELQTTPEFVTAAHGWLRIMHAANWQTPTLPRLALAKILAARWAAVCLHAAPHNPSIWHIFWQSPLAPFVDRSLPKNHPIPNP